VPLPLKPKREEKNPALGLICSITGICLGFSVPVLYTQFMTSAVMSRAVKSDDGQCGAYHMANKPLTSRLQALDVHESHRTGGSQTPGNGKLLGITGIFGQMN